MTRIDVFCRNEVSLLPKIYSEIQNDFDPLHLFTKNTRASEKPPLAVLANIQCLQDSVEMRLFIGSMRQ